MGGKRKANGSPLPAGKDQEPPQYETIFLQDFHSWYMSRVYAHFEAFDKPIDEPGSYSE